MKTKTKCCEWDATGTEESFKIQISDRAKEIDPNSELDWYALTLGWAISQKITIDQAHSFALHIRYHTELG